MVVIAIYTRFCIERFYLVVLGESSPCKHVRVQINDAESLINRVEIGEVAVKVLR